MSGSLTAGLRRLTMPQLLALGIAVQAAVLGVLAFGVGAASLTHPSRGGVFVMHVNGWHLFAHLAMGLSAVIALRSPRAASGWVIGAGLVSLGWAAAGLLSDHEVLGLIRDDTPGSIIHAVEGVALIAVGAFMGPAAKPLWPRAGGSRALAAEPD